MTRVLLGALLLSGTAHAYVLYTSPEYEEVPLRWRTKGITFVFDDRLPQEIVESAAQSTIASSFDVWSALSCTGTATSFPFQNGGVVSGKSVGFSEEDGASNENLVAWVGSAWSHPSSVVALTSLTYDVHTGEIVDADIELNDRDFVFSTDPSLSEMDLSNTAVHEIGHLLGLDHSRAPAATMYATAPPEETKKRDLTQDDIDGFCAIYGPKAVAFPEIIGVPTDAGCIKHVQDDGSLLIDCATPAEQSVASTCEAGPRGAGSGAFAPAFALAALCGLARRRRERADRRSV